MSRAGAARTGTVALAALLATAVLAPARGEIPACSAATAGQLSRQVDVQCACQHVTASRAAGTPAGWRWDCGILRPRLNHTVPVDLNLYPYGLPAALALEPRRHRDPHPKRPRRHGDAFD